MWRVYRLTRKDEGYTNDKLEISFEWGTTRINIRTFIISKHEIV